MRKKVYIIARRAGVDAGCTAYWTEYLKLSCKMSQIPRNNTILLQRKSSHNEKISSIKISTSSWLYKPRNEERLEVEVEVEVWTTAVRKLAARRLERCHHVLTKRQRQLGLASRSPARAPPHELFGQNQLWDSRSSTRKPIHQLTRQDAYWGEKGHFSLETVRFKRIVNQLLIIWK